MIEQQQDLMSYTNRYIMRLSVLHNPEDTEELPQYIQWITAPAPAPAFKWINIITIKGHSVRPNDWRAISKIQNLGALFIHHGFLANELLYDSIIQNWAMTLRMTELFLSSNC